MSEARKRILQMLAEGKISVEQSEDLLGALDTDKKAQETSGIKGSFGAFSNEVGNLAKQMKKQIKEAMAGMESPKHEIKCKLKNIGTWVQDMMGSMASEFSFIKDGPIDGIDVEFSIPEPEGFLDCQSGEIKNLYGSIRLTEGNSFALRVKGRISKGSLEGQPPMSWFSNNAICVKENVLFVGINGNKPVKALFNLDLTLPSTISLRLKSVSANINAKGALKIAGIQTVSGDVVIEGGKFCEGGVETVSGNASFDDAELSMFFKSTSGDLSINNSNVEQLAINSVSGDVSLLKPKVSPKTSVDISTTSGDILIKEVNGQIGQAEVHTRTGDLESKWSGSVQQMGNHSLNLDSGISGATFKIETVSGDVLLE